MFTRPALGGLHGTRCILEARASCVRQHQLEDGLQKVVIQVQRNVYEGELRVLESDHVSWCVQEEENFCAEGKLKEACAMSCMKDPPPRLPPV